MVVEIRQTDEYATGFDKLRDRQARARILARIRRLSLGNAGDAEPVGEGVSEMRIHYGPGYRIYFKSLGEETVVLLAGGNKRSQKQDIEKVKELARNL